MYKLSTMYALTGILVLIASERLQAQEGGIEVLAGETIYHKGVRTSASYIYKRKANLYDGSRRISDPLDRVVEEHRIVAGVDYGVLPDLTASLLIPVVYREQRTKSGPDTGSLRAFGLGDIALLAKYRLYKTDWERSSFNWSLIGGMEFPSGRTNDRDNGMRLPPSLQAGSGSWDPFFATAATMSLDRFRFDARILFKINTEGTQDFKDGNFLAIEFDFAYRFLFEKFPGPTASAKIGLQWRHKERSKWDGHKIGDSGSNELVFRPGLGFHPIPRIDISTSLTIPLYRYFHGSQLAQDIRIVFAFGFRF